MCVVGDVLVRKPHGDTAVYDALVSLAISQLPLLPLPLPDSVLLLLPPHLHHTGAPGPGLLHAVAAGGRARQLWFAG